MRSLQTRLSSGLLISLTVVFTIQWLLVSRALHLLMEDHIESRLEQDIDVLLASVRLDNAGKIILDVNHVDPRYLQPFSGAYYQVRANKELLRSRSLWDEELSVPNVTTGTMSQHYTTGPTHQKLLMVVGVYQKQSSDIVIAVAEDLASVQDDIETFQWRYGMVSIAMLLLLFALHVWMVRRGLRPLEQVHSEMAALEKGEIQQLTRSVPREIAPLVEQVNHLVHAMQQRLQRSRNALGNLAHALKTPLTTLMQTYEREEVAQYPELRQQLDRHTNVVRELIDRELKRARLAGSAVPAQQYLLEPEINALIDTLTRVYREKALRWERFFPSGALCNMDREDLLELLGNLLDNACKWATQRVAVTVRTGTVWQFIVEDDGAGVPEEKIAGLAQRGVRIDEQTAGNGLGLAIVKDLVQYYGGEIHFGRSPRLGGFMVRVAMPLGSV